MPRCRRGHWAALAAALLSCLLALAVPTLASAAEYTVDSTADEVDAAPGGGCETAEGVCTLRAAVEEANATPAADAVRFASTFDGKTGDAIALTMGAIPILEPLQLLGSAPGQQCETSAATGTPPSPIPGPCVEVAGAGLDVESSGVLVRGLAITGAAAAIDVLGGSTGFEAQNDWVGVKLDGTAAANGSGIYLGPGSDGAVIGGPGPVNPVEPEANPARNVIAGNDGVGLDLEGASDASIQGNYLGVGPDGTEALANSKDVEVTDSTQGGLTRAEGDEIGGTLEGLAPATRECDDACNVISGATEAGVDLQGDGAGQNEAPASGPTAILGNDIGLDAAGAGALPNGTDGVQAGAAANVVVGGAPFTEGNHVVGGEYGVRGSGGDDLRVVGNQIGFDGRGGSGPLLAPSKVGILVDSQGLSGPLAAAEIRFNLVQASAVGEGIEQRSAGARITGNIVSGGSVGIRTLGAVGPVGNSIQGNSIQRSGRAIVVENGGNAIAANEVLGFGAAGIQVVDGAGVAATGNVIGGDTLPSENILSEGLGDAIQIVGPPGGGENEVARNRGEGNGDLFVDLGADGPGNPGLNGGVQPPTLSSATQSGAAGSAEPGARVRVFRKTTPEPGELESFLGEAVADGGGSWSVAYPSSIPVDTPVAATQTNVLGGTSELATAATAPPPPPSPPAVGPPPCYAGGLGCPAPPRPRTAAPRTRITKGPPKRSRRRGARFEFSSSQRGSTFQCRLDRGRFKRCRSPKRYRHLRVGGHVFRVRAVNRQGVVDRTPAVRRFRILPRRRHAAGHRRSNDRRRA
jgi:CSLREA domain-containing protein